MGGREKTVSDEEILRIIEDDEDLVLSTKDVADAIEFSRRGAHPRLSELEERGYLGRKRAGRTDVWWVTEAGRRFLESDPGD